MQYRELAPPPPLRGLVRCLWWLDRTYSDSGPAELVWPSTTVELIVHFGDRYRRASDVLPHAFVIGPLTRFVTLGSNGRVRLIGARCFPWGFAHLFGQPLRELRNLTLPLDALAPRAARQLTERLAEAEPSRALEILTTYLIGQLRSKDRLATWRGVRRASSVDALVAESGLSLRQLERHFDDYVGVSPKQLVRIERFNRARQAIVQDGSRNLLDIAYAHAYADYAHMTRDFKDFLGLTPATFRNWARTIAGEPADVEFLQKPAPA
jgi:AraC-like DNA-binding protein